MQTILKELVTAGHSQADAVKAIKLALQMSPVEGASRLREMGASYHHAFKVLSQPHIAAKEEVARDDYQAASASPLVFVFLGLALGVGGYFLTKWSYGDAVARNADHFYVAKGLFYAAGGCFVTALYRWVRG